MLPQESERVVEAQVMGTTVARLDAVDAAMSTKRKKPRKPKQVGWGANKRCQEGGFQRSPPAVGGNIVVGAGR